VLQSVRRPSSDYLAVAGTLTEWTGGCSSGGKKNDKIILKCLHHHYTRVGTCCVRRNLQMQTL